jgi:hypothetical protein
MSFCPATYLVIAFHLVRECNKSIVLAFLSVESLDSIPPRR